MACFDFVCRATSSLYKTRNIHPPYLRSQSDLNNLIYVANVMNDTKSPCIEVDDDHVIQTSDCS